MSGPPPLRIFVDADGCPVKEEVYRVGARLELEVVVATNRWMRVPLGDRVRLAVIEGGFDAVDDWIAGAVVPGDVVVTADVPLAARCLEAGARVLGPRGREFAEESIGDALATRALLADLRQGGLAGTGPAPFDQRDRRHFLQELDRLVQASLRARHEAEGVNARGMRP